MSVVFRINNLHHRQPLLLQINPTTIATVISNTEKVKIIINTLQIYIMKKSADICCTVYVYGNKCQLELQQACPIY